MVRAGSLGARSPLLVVSGPTAGGKSALALRLAKELCAEVVSADSVQVYRGLSVGSAKLSSEEMDGVRHHALDLVDCSQHFDAAHYLEAADTALASIQEKGRLGIVCGGTTLYLGALLHGLADLPAGETAVRELLERRSNESLHEELGRIDPELGVKLHPNDRLRIIRALEVYSLTGESPSEIYRRQSSAVRYNGLVLVLCWPRPKLYGRIAQRTRWMLQNGLLEETREVLSRCGERAPPLRTLGYAQAAAVLLGSLTEAQLEEEITKLSCRYAKRQMTFWRNEPGKRGWGVSPPQMADRVQLGAEEMSGSGKHRLLGFSVLEYDYEALCRSIKERFTRSFEGIELWYLSAEKLIEEA